VELKTIIGFALIPLVLLLAAIFVDSADQWSTISQHTVPWLCSALSIAVLVVGLTSLLCGCAPAEIPLLKAILVCTVVLVIFAVGLFVDAWTYDGHGGRWVTAGAEGIGFAVILAGAFLVPRRFGPATGE